MLGFGETHEDLVQTWQDLLVSGCDILTMGQYLQPSADHLPVKRFLPPEEFAELEKEALDLGFSGVASGPFVRSSYQAEKLYRHALRRMKRLAEPSI
jgi:lipoic acid synthetase